MTAYVVSPTAESIRQAVLQQALYIRHSVEKTAVCEQLFTHHKCWYPEAVCPTEKVTGNSTFSQRAWEEAAQPVWLKEWTGWHHEMTQDERRSDISVRKTTRNHMVHSCHQEGAPLTVNRHILHPRLPKQSTNLWKSQIMTQRPAGEPGAFQPCAAREG